MNEKIIELIEFSSESSLLDFKRQEYPVEVHYKKHEILKDISAMANHPSNDDKFIIIGVEEVGGVASNFYEISTSIDEAKYQQFLESNIEPKINFEYKPIRYKDCQLMCFRIFNNNDRPYLIKKNVQNYSDTKKNEYREGDGYIRVGTSTKKINREILDKIYTDKYRKFDRRPDIIITPHIKSISTGYLANAGIVFIDFDIENQSAKSICLDVEVKIFKCDEIQIMERGELEYQLKVENQKKNRDPWGNVMFSPIFRDLNQLVDLEEFEDYYIAKRNRPRSEKTGL